jgi:predicted transposase/invertase (TIGR01784 family)
LYYWAKLYTEQLKESDDYATLSKAIGIHILNFTSIPESNKYHNVFHIVEKENGIKYFKDLELHTIELKKFTESVNNELTDLIARIKTSLDIWVSFLTKYHLFDRNHLPASLETNQGLKKALKVLEVMNFTEIEREEYENHLKWLQIQTNTLKNYEAKGEIRGFQMGVEQGIAQGIEQGIVQGIEQGIVQGIEQIAINLLKNKESLEKISQLTGLSREKITQLNSFIAAEA